MYTYTYTRVCGHTLLVLLLWRTLPNTPTFEAFLSNLNDMKHAQWSAQCSAHKC